MTALRSTANGFEAAVLVGADGVNGVDRAALGLGGAIVYGVALEGNVPYERLSRSALRAARSCSSSATSPAATAGSFRRATTSTSASAAGDTRARSCARTWPCSASAHGFDPDALENLRGHRLPCAGAPRRRGRALLVGDAAGAGRSRLGRRHVRGVRQRRGSPPTAALDLLAGRADARAVPSRRSTARSARTLPPLEGEAALGRFPWAVFTVMRLPVTWGRAREADAR